MQKVKASKVTLGILFWILDKKILCKYKNKIKVCFTFFFFFIYLRFWKNMCFVCNSMGNVPCWGRYNLSFEALKGLLLKNTPYGFSDFYRKCHATIPEHNSVDTIGWPQPQNISLWCHFYTVQSDKYWKCLSVPPQRSSVWPYGSQD